jgi:hypothetical protein
MKKGVIIASSGAKDGFDGDGGVGSIVGSAAIYVSVCLAR